MFKASKLLTIFFALFINTTIYADIKDVYPVFSKIVTLAEKNCGQISMKLPNWAEIKNGGLIINKSDSTAPKYMNSFVMSCYDKNNVPNTDLVFFNKETKQWELNPTIWEEFDKDKAGLIKSNFTIENIIVKNGSGWIVTEIGIGSGSDDFSKYLTFCLERKNTHKVLCGYGIVQYIPRSEDIGMTENDYTQMITGFIKSIEFIPENKSLYGDKK